MTSSSWTDQSITNKMDALRQLCIETEQPVFFPQTIEQFCEWADDAKGLRRFSRPVIYKERNESHRKEALRLIGVGKERWRSAGLGDDARMRELESLTKLLASRYHQERQLRQDAQNDAAALRASVNSLSAKLRELTGTRQVKLVPTNQSSD